MNATVPASPKDPPRSRARATLSLVLKLAVVAGIFAYLIHKDSIRPENLRELAAHWGWAFLALCLYLLTTVVCTLRFKILLSALNVSVPYFDVLPATFIGSFFDLVSPVTSGGDVVKAHYICRAGKFGGQKSDLGLVLLGALLDRITGFFGLFVLGLIVSILAWPEIGGMPNLRRMTMLLALVCIAVMLGFFVMVSERLEKSVLRKRLMHCLPFHEKIESIYAGFSGLRHHHGKLLAMVAISILNHICVCSMVLVLGQAMQFFSVATGERVPLPLMQCMTVLPIGLTINMFGVAGGFGPGNLAFEALFKEVLGITGGATLILYFQIVAVIARLLGGVCVLFYKPGTPKISAAAPPQGK